MSRHPIQPIETDPHGTVRFKDNKIVRYLLDKGCMHIMNQIAREDFSQDDRDQFHQLIGYSVSGAPISEDIRDVALRMQVTGGDACDAEREVLREKLAEVRALLRSGVAALFNIHPDDLGDGQD